MTFSLPVTKHPDGDYLDLSQILPPHCVGCVLCYNKGSGLVPLPITGAKRLYVRELEDLAATDPEIAEFTVIPIHEYNNIAKL